MLEDCEKNVQKEDLKTINSLLDKRFFIPKYQRGYRWGKQQVEDLLNDINDFNISKDQLFYCLQPLVVANREEENDFEVIDGQQRLTTIFIILKYLQKMQVKGTPNQLYEIQYETRDESKSLLEEKISSQTSINEENIDFFHMSQCYITVKEWFEGKDNGVIESFPHKLLDEVSFIWYVDRSGKPVETFTRLNIDKIPLTNAELIKAMLLKQSNFTDDSQNNEEFRLTQFEMAIQWDEIEFTLQNEDFWYFIHPQKWEKDKPRIDFIFDLIKSPEIDSLKFQPLEEDIGHDEYTSFRYFYKYLNQKKTGDNKSLHTKIWDEVRRIFQIFREWFDDITFYHYIGFLTNCYGYKQVTDLIPKWHTNTKKEFIESLKKVIKGKIETLVDLKKEYPGSTKTNCRPLLLLFNIQTVINQNQELVGKYGKGGFYKFPFYLYTIEKWDIEHIASSTDNPLTERKHQIEWLNNMYLILGEKLEKDEEKLSDDIELTNKELKDKIKACLFDKQDEEDTSFDELRVIIEVLYKKYYPNDTPFVEKKKNTICNYVLLDRNLNRSYQNSIFPAKRRIIIGKDQGKSLNVIVNDKDELVIDIKSSNTSFIPPCTRNVFMKYYTPNSTDIMTWSEHDADAYVTQIYKTLNEFDVQNPFPEKQNQ